jgi:hypothetical protein
MLEEVGREMPEPCFTWVLGTDDRADIRKAVCPLDA